MLQKNTQKYEDLLTKQLNVRIVAAQRLQELSESRRNDGTLWMTEGQRIELAEIIALLTASFPEIW